MGRQETFYQQFQSVKLSEGQNAKAWRKGIWTLHLGLALSTMLTPVVKANVVGNETQNFNPTSNGVGFVTVQGSQTLPVGYFNLGLFVDHAINTMPVFAGGDASQSRTKINDYVTTTHIHAGMGLAKNWDLGISLPYVVAEKFAGSQESYGNFVSTGVTSIDINTKVRLWEKDQAGVAIIGSVNLNQLKDNPYRGSNSGPTYNLELAGDLQLGEFLLGANIGHRWHKAGTANDPNSPIQPTGNEFIWSAASTLALNPENALIFEIFGSAQIKGSRNDSDRGDAANELDVSYKHLLMEKALAITTGLGTELTHGKSSPDWRLFAGINWTFGPKKEVPPPPAPNPAPVMEKPAPKVAVGPLGPIKKEENITVHDVLFKFNSDQLVLRGQNTSIFKLQQQLSAGGGFKQLMIIGHTDSVGSDNFNLKLSARRAKTIRDWLVKNYNIDGGKIVVVGKGESNPIASNLSDHGRQKNRRVEFRISR